MNKTNSFVITLLETFKKEVIGEEKNKNEVERLIQFIKKDNKLAEAMTVALTSQIVEQVATACKILKEFEEIRNDN